MYILSTVKVHTDFNPITTEFRGTHRDAELCDFTEPPPMWSLDYLRLCGMGVRVVKGRNACQMLSI